MRKIIVVILVIALFYAFQLFSQNSAPQPEKIEITRSEQENSTKASFTGGLIILVAVGTGYLVRRLYSIRSSAGH